MKIILILNGTSTDFSYLQPTWVKKKLSSSIFFSNSIEHIISFVTFENVRLATKRIPIEPSPLERYDFGLLVQPNAE